MGKYRTVVAYKDYFEEFLNAQTPVDSNAKFPHENN